MDEKAKAKAARRAKRASKPRKKSLEEEETEQNDWLASETQRAAIATTRNADRFFKFHAKYGPLNVAPRVAGGVTLILLSLIFFRKFRKALAFYERNRLTEDEWGNAP